jgi:integrase/recombinase XerD
MNYLERYFRESRKAILKQKSSEIVFPSNREQAITRQTLWHRVKY